MDARRLIVTGKVQGVWYRDWFVREARGLGLSGWVRNRTDGSVEAFVQGAGAAVQAIVVLAGRGSPAARVTGVEQHAAEPEALTGFERRPTHRI